MFCKFCGAKLEDGQAYCDHCGAKLEDGRPETQQAAETQQPAAPKKGLSQEQKDEMKKSVSEAGESAKAAGKALWNSAKVVSSAALGQAKVFGGAALDQAKQLAGSAQGAMADGSLKDSPVLYRMILMGFGALHVLLLFVLSYAKLGKKGEDLLYFERLFHITLPKRMTGPAFLKFMDAVSKTGVGGSDADATYAMVVVIFALPVVCGLLLILLNLLAVRSGKQGGMISSIVLSSVTLLDYVLIKALMVNETEPLTEMGYKMGFGFGFVVIAALVAVQIAVAVKGHIACKKARAAA